MILITISGSLVRAGVVHSHHHQAMTSAGSLTVVATSDDGVIEAVQDVNRLWYIGVQWHPERTEDVQLGQGLFTQLVKSSTKDNRSKYFMTIPSPLQETLEQFKVEYTVQHEETQREGAATGQFNTQLLCEFLPWGDNGCFVLATTGIVELEYAALQKSVADF